MINGKLGGGTISKDLPFELIVSTIRRKKFLGNFLKINIRRDNVQWRQEERWGNESNVVLRKVASLVKVDTKLETWEWQFKHQIK